MDFIRHPANPIITPGLYDWRRACVFNPGVLLDDDGRVYLFERAAGSLRPFICHIGALGSDDGVRFTHLSDQPVFTPRMCGSPYGSVQDPRVVKIDGVYYMTFAYRPFAWSSHPTGVGVPESHETEFPGVVRAAPDTGKGSANVQGARPDNNTRSGIAVSTDRLHWSLKTWVTPPEIDDRNLILFPEKIGGRFAALRRPLDWVGPQYGTEHPAIWITFSEDLIHWSDARLLIKSQSPWEGNRIGGSTPPIRTRKGWLVPYHGVETVDASTRRVVYRMGAMLLDLHNPTRVIARTRNFLFEPEAYYERFGLYIPNVVFPTGAFVRDGLLHLYYGVCDTAIALATVEVDALVEHVMNEEG